MQQAEEHEHLITINTDWRRQLQRNKRRTRYVILMFLLFYLGVGLLIDLYLYAGDYPYDSLTDILNAIITFHLIPRATLVTMAVALISLFVTYTFYDKIMLLGTEYHEITSDSENLEERQLYNVVEELKVAAGLNFMPRVYIIEADYMNAFASGYSQKSAMVAITRGLMEKLNRSELQAVMAHELSHVKNGDIKLTLAATVLTNILLVAIDLMFYNIVFGNRDRERGDQRLVFVIIMLRYLLPITTLLLMLYLSRTREYMADAGCVELMRDNIPLAKALIKINQDHVNNQEKYNVEYNQTAHEDVRRAAYLYDPVQSGIESIKSLANIFSTHPTLEQRLAALGVKTTQ